MNRRFLIRLFTFLGGVYFFVEYLIPEKIGSFQFNRYHDQITQGLMAVTAMTFGLGLVNILFIHGGKIIFKKKDWFNSIGLILGLLTMLIVTARDWSASARIGEKMAPFVLLSDFALRIESDAKGEVVTRLPTNERKALLLRELAKALDTVEQADSLRAGNMAGPYEQKLLDAQRALIQDLNQQMVLLDVDQAGFAAAAPLANQIRAVGQAMGERLRYQNRFTRDAAIYKLLYDGLFIALGSAMFSLLGFYMAAAAYRAFRIRSYESALMMAAAIIVMLGQIPFGLWIWEGFTDLRLWLLSTPSTGAFRAVKLGASVAGLVMAFRMWLSIETDSFADQSESSS